MEDRIGQFIPCYIRRHVRRCHPTTCFHVERVFSHGPRQLASLSMSNDNRQQLFTIAGPFKPSTLSVTVPVLFLPY
jgi:hypothetical protein